MRRHGSKLGRGVYFAEDPVPRLGFFKGVVLIRWSNVSQVLMESLSLRLHCIEPVWSNTHKSAYLQSGAPR